jgi:Uma2 family endonuclease
MATSDPVQRAVRKAPAAPERRATVAQWLAEPEEKGAELIHGQIVYKALPKLEHGLTQTKLAEALGPFNRRPGGADRPGGWWLGSEVDMLLVGEGLRPDLAGWRRDRVGKLPQPGPQGVVTERPDWVAEILSTSTAARDWDDKLRIYHAAEVTHYWILDPQNRILIVYRRTPDGYLLVRAANAGMTVRAEPFDALELSVGFIFGDDEEDEVEGGAETP